MVRLLSIVLLALLALASALPPRVAAEEGPAATPPEQARAREVKAALAAKDADALKRLVGEAEPDPWLVVDVLVREGRFDEAAAFASAAQGVDVAGLAAYVTAQRDRRQTPEAFVALEAALDARRRGEHEAALKALGSDPDVPPADVTAVRSAQLRGELLARARRYREAHPPLRRAAAAAQRMGWLRLAARVHAHAGQTAWRARSFEEALASFTRQREVSETRRDAEGAAEALGNMALATGDLQQLHEAHALFERALAEQADVSSEARVAITLGNHGTVLQRLGRSAEARRAYEKSLEIKRRGGDRVGEAITLDNIGRLHEWASELGPALDAFRMAMAKWEALKSDGNVADCRRRIGRVLRLNGKYAEAFAALEEACALAEKAGATRVLAKSTNELARGFGSLGQDDRALAAYQRALVHAHQARSRSATYAARMGIANSHARREEHDKALAIYRDMETELRARGSTLRLAGVLGNIAVLESARDDHVRSLALAGEALALLDEAQRDRNKAFILRTIGIAYWRLGKAKDAERYLRRSVAQARSNRETPWLLRCLAALASFYLDQGKPARALSTAQRGLDLAEDLFGGLGVEQGATARAQISRLFDAGAVAAAREDDAFEAFAFLESGRAGALLDAMGHHEAERWRATSVSPALRAKELEARAEEAAARASYDRAFARRRMAAIKSARTRLDAARAAVRAIADRIQRDVRQRGSIFYPVPKTLDEVRRTLRADEAFVLFGAGDDEAFALVVRPKGERIVRLGPREAIEKALTAFDPVDTEASAAPSLASMQALLVKPLALDPAVKRVMISPSRDLAYVPFGALMKPVVAMSPSGTTHVLLKSRAHSGGTGVLALGAPDYAGVSEGARQIYFRGQTLTPLPATRVEVERVGTATLLGAAANEVAFARLLATQERWQSIHFACHGLVDVEHPMLSSLALSRSEGSDGFLTGLEILRMQLRTDLAVLSACETGRGEIAKGEGIIGLTRAFMFAGAPRVICSLWKVDDQATQVLMQRFYELWRPADGSEGVPPAEALQKAQAFVRDHPKHPEWKHPFYWAAWVLWGLP